MSDLSTREQLIAEAKESALIYKGSPKLREMVLRLVDELDRESGAQDLTKVLAAIDRMMVVGANRDSLEDLRQLVKALPGTSSTQVAPKGEVR